LLVADDRLNLRGFERVPVLSPWPLPSAEGLFCRLSDRRKQEVLIRKSQ
jgi:hypothetical protein